MLEIRSFSSHYYEIKPDAFFPRHIHDIPTVLKSITLECLLHRSDFHHLPVQCATAIRLRVLRRTQ